MEHPAKPTAARRSWPRWSSTLLDHLIRPQQERLRDREAEGLGGLEVDHQLKSRGLLNGKLRRLRSPQDLVDEIRRPTVHFGKVWPIRHETPVLGELARA